MKNTPTEKKMIKLSVKVAKLKGELDSLSNEIRNSKPSSFSLEEIRLLVIEETASMLNNAYRHLYSNTNL